MIKRLSLPKAEQQLKFNPKRASIDILKLLKSAQANAVHNYQLDPNDLFVSKVNVTDGPTLKRVMPRARGSAYIIRHRTCHVDLTLKPIEGKTATTKTTTTKEKVKKVRTTKSSSKIGHTKSTVKATKGTAKNIVQRKVIN